MKLKRITALIGVLSILIPCFGFATFADDLVEDVPIDNVETPSDNVIDDTVSDNTDAETPDAPQVSIPAYTVAIKYSEDSSTIKGISYETCIDPVTLAVSFKILNSLSIGHVIYDNPDTAYIDGIRVNGKTVDSLVIPVTQGTSYEVVIRTVYEEGLLGDVAKIIDGTFDFSTIVENPIMLLTAIYYVISIASILVASISTIMSKRKKVKSADEIASKVDESAKNAVEKIRTEVTETVLAEAIPILTTILEDMHNVVTAVVLSTSKNKEAPLAMLDTFQKSATSTDVTALIDSIRKKVSEGIAKNDSDHAANAEELHRIANTANDTDDVKSDSSDESSAPTLPSTNTKSIF
jgi:hypothetical protein